jgi:hypothetical protein
MHFRVYQQSGQYKCGSASNQLRSHSCDSPQKQVDNKQNLHLQVTVVTTWIRAMAAAYISAFSTSLPPATGSVESPAPPPAPAFLPRLLLSAVHLLILSKVGGLPPPAHNRAHRAAEPYAKAVAAVASLVQAGVHPSGALELKASEFTSELLDGVTDLLWARDVQWEVVEGGVVMELLWLACMLGPGQAVLDETLKPVHKLLEYWQASVSMGAGTASVQGRDPFMRLQDQVGCAGLGGGP